ncbi:Alcohol dehydrogenase [Rhodovulum sp. P5]|uniref:iron-containing alcohol dehydrogenase n=1 Tax=Rhodovulum sp. P5 TaxID=1564506 RepID=UPI0009C2993B|nr:iron-containing alcohol dehydrogenase [Rhodovulum sp. P5]ARE41150.1 Alcohol dehydrogenase [Rhodovulum sp. P5]
MSASDWAALATPPRTVSGRGCRGIVLQALAAFLGPVLLVRGQSVAWADTLAEELRAEGRAVHTVLSRGEPALPALEASLSALRGADLQAVVAVGGGSAIDLGKALAALLRVRGPVPDYLEVVGRGLPLDAAPLPFIAVPTTAGTGAEATKNAVIDIPDHQRKVSLRDTRMIPRIAVLDADLTDGMPWPVTLMTGLDAITQLIEPLLSARATPATDVICRGAIGPAMRALIRLSDGECPEARATMLMAAHLSGIALANAGLGAVHGVAGVIGGQTGAPHGAICGQLLPKVLRVNRRAAAQAGLDTTQFDEVDAIIADAFGRPGQSAAELLQGFVDRHGLPGWAGTALSPDIDRIVDMARASSSMKANPVALSPEELTEVLRP